MARGSSSIPINDLEPIGQLTDVLIGDADSGGSVLQDHPESASRPHEPST
jgi:hypothetical protein